MNSYTVILLYPDYLSKGTPQTYLAQVEAADVAGAIESARRMANSAPEPGLPDDGSSGPPVADDPTDFLCLAVFRGEQDDIYQHDDHRSIGWVE
jgi:hypothetical protein